MRQATIAEVREELERTGRFRGLRARPKDAYVVHEVYVKRGYRDCVEPGAVILDLGAGIGDFARWAVEQGAAHVVSVEPNDRYYDLLRANTIGLPVTVHEAAVGPHDLLYRTTLDIEGSTGSLSSARNGKLWRHTPPKDVVRVPCVDLRELVATHTPTHVKCDIEGAEYDLDLPAALGESVRVLRIELHRRNLECLEQMHALMDRFDDAGWSIDRPLRKLPHQSGWPAIRTWRR